jgi:hypothetical protein
MPSSEATSPARDSTPGVREWVAVIGLLILLFVLNLATATRYPNVWCDEVMYTDPGAHLALGKGFVSTAWYAQTSDRFWAGNTPLHPFLLSVWIRVFGFSALTVRSLNYVWFLLAVFFLWLFCVRTQFVPKTGARLLLIILLAMDSAVSFSYRAARPDMLGFLLVTLLMCAATLRSVPVRYVCLVILGALLPWEGLQLLPPFALMAGIVLVFWGWRKAWPFIVAGFAAGLSLLGLAWFYISHGVWKEFVASIAPHTTAHSTLVAKLTQVPRLFVLDRGGPFLLLLALILAIAAVRAGNGKAVRTLAFGLAAGVLIPLGIHAFGLFSIYYGWMAVLPLGLALCRALAEFPLQGRWLKTSAGFLLACAMFVGLPSRLLVTFLRTGEKPYADLEAFVRTGLRSSDKVYTDYLTYYPAMAGAEKVYTQFYLASMTPAERDAMTVLIIAPEGLPGFQKVIPGDWIQVGEFKNEIHSDWLPEFVIRRLRSSTQAAIYAPYHVAIYRKALTTVP